MSNTPSDTPSDTPERPKAPFRMTPVVFHVLLSLADGEAHAYRVMKEIGRVKGVVSVERVRG